MYLCNGSNENQNKKEVILSGGVSLYCNIFNHENVLTSHFGSKRKYFSIFSLHKQPVLNLIYDKK